MLRIDEIRITSVVEKKENMLPQVTEDSKLNESTIKTEKKDEPIKRSPALERVVIKT